MKQQVDQHADKLGNLKASCDNLSSGISEVAGRVVGLEDNVKTLGTAPAGATTQGPAESFDPWAASANALVGAAENLGQQGGTP